MFFDSLHCMGTIFSALEYSNPGHVAKFTFWIALRYLYLTGNPAAHIAYNLPSVESLVRYMHVAAGFPVKSTYLKAIKKGNFATWPVLTYSSVEEYCPHAVETIKEHMVQSSQGVQSTKKKKHQSRGNKNSPVQATLEKEY